MRFQAFALFMAVGTALAQGVTEKIAPKAPSPANCKSGIQGKFEIAIVALANVQKREFIAHQVCLSPLFPVSAPFRPSESSVPSQLGLRPVPPARGPAPLRRSPTTAPSQHHHRKQIKS